MIHLISVPVLLSLRNESEKNASYWSPSRAGDLHTMWRAIADIASETLEIRGLLEITVGAQDEPDLVTRSLVIRTHRQTSSIERCALRQAYFYAGRQDDLSNAWRAISFEAHAQDLEGSHLSFTARKIPTEAITGVQCIKESPVLWGLNKANNSTKPTPTSIYIHENGE